MLRIKDTWKHVSYVAGQLQVTLARGLGCPVLALSSVGRAAYRLGETGLEGRLAAFKEAGELEYTTTPPCCCTTCQRLYRRL